MRKVLTILQLNTYDQWGGAEKVAMQLHRFWLSQGHHAYLGVKQRFTQEPQVFGLNEIDDAALEQAKYKNRPNKRGQTRQLLYQSASENKAKLLSSRKRRLRAGLRRLPYWEPCSHVFHDLRAVFRQADAAKQRGQQKTSRLAGSWHVLGERWRGHELFAYPKARALISALPRRPDIIHCHNLHGNYFDLHLLAEWSRHVPVIWTLHDQWALTGHCAHSMDCKRWETGCGACPDLKRYPPLLRDGTAYNWQRKKRIYEHTRLSLVAPSRWLLDCAERSMIKAAAQKACVIGNGIDLTIFKPGSQRKARLALSLPLDLPIVLCAYSQSKSVYKDVAGPEHVLARSAREMPGLLLLRLGGGSNASEQSCRISSMNGFSTYSFPFQKDAHRLILFYQAADIYLSTSKADTFPSVLLEASAASLPIVASQVGGVSEVVDEAKTGFLLPSGAYKEMAQKICYLFCNPQVRKAMGEAGLMKARSLYNEKAMFAQYKRLYTESMAAKKRTS